MKYYLKRGQCDMSIKLNKFNNLEGTNKGLPIYIFGGNR